MPVDLEIAGHLDVQDFLNIQPMMPVPRPRGYKTGWRICYLVSFVLCGLLGYVAEEGKGAAIAVTGAFEFSLFCLLFAKIASAVVLRHYRAKAEINNTGEVSYRLEGDHVEFRGPTFDCSIPLASIRKVVRRRGSSAMVFGNQAYFVIPRQVTRGDLEAFLEAIAPKPARLDRD
jgi:hypothetical protein